jgi:hypothetical protein
MALFHSATLTEKERKFFRFTNGAPREIQASEFRPSGVYAQLQIGNNFGELFAGGDGWRRSSEGVIDVLYVGSAVKRLGGSAGGAFTWPDGTQLVVQLQIGEGAGTLPGTVTGGGGSIYAGGDDTVQPPADPGPPSAPPPLPSGNGNGGFQGGGSPGLQTGITGGN